MKSGLYTIIEFDENNKWFVLSETIYNNEIYEYLIKVNKEEDDFIEDFMVVKCIIQKEEEYFSIVKDKDTLAHVLPKLIPGTEAILKNPKEALLKILNS